MSMLTAARAATRQLKARWRSAVLDERGDVPGWVLITLMSAGVVLMLWAVAGELLVQVFTDAINRVSGF